MERIQEAMKCDVYARSFHYRHLTFKLQSEIKVNHKLYLIIYFFLVFYKFMTAINTRTQLSSVLRADCGANVHMHTFINY